MHFRILQSQMDCPNEELRVYTIGRVFASWQDFSCKKAIVESLTANVHTPCKTRVWACVDWKSQTTLYICKYVYICRCLYTLAIHVLPIEFGWDNQPPKMSLHTTRILGVKAFWRSIVWEIWVREQWPKMMKMHGSCLKLGAPNNGRRKMQTRRFFRPDTNSWEVLLASLSLFVFVKSFCLADVFFPNPFFWSIEFNLQGCGVPLPVENIKYYM